MIMIIYINDLLIIDFNEKNIIVFKKSFSKRFRIKNLNFVFFNLNVKITRNRVNKIMHFNQTTYIKQLGETCEFIDCKSIFIFMKQTFLYHDVFDDQFYQIIKAEITSYVEIIDKLQWLIDNIKQHIIYVINKLFQFMKNFTFIHVQTIKRMIRYFKEIMLLNKRFESFKSYDDIFYEYIDFLYNDDEFTRRFHSSYAFLLWNDVISHVFKRQNTISIFSTETKYVDQCNVVKKIYFLKQILNELNEKIIDFMKIRTDN